MQGNKKIIKNKEREEINNHEKLLELFNCSSGYLLVRITVYVFWLLLPAAGREFPCLERSRGRNKLYLVPIGSNRGNGNCDYWGVVIFPEKYIEKI